MSMRRAVPVIPLILLVFLLGCSTSSQVTTPVTESNRDASEIAAHHLWGLYKFTADPDAATLEVEPVRMGDMHLNALFFIEPPAGKNLTIENLHFSGDTIDLDIGLRHPFLGMTEFTGFDVKGILISDGSIGGFADTDLLLPGPGNFRLLNPDGLTRWWNPSEFPVNAGNMFSYKDGLFGSPYAQAGFTATVNGYKYFTDSLTDPDSPMTDVNPIMRGLFSAGKKNTRHYKIQMGDDGISFNYAIDASWEFPSGTQPWEAPGDFDPGANGPEPWFVSTYVDENSLWNDGQNSGGHLKLSVEAYDWFNADQDLLSIESPGNFIPMTDEPPLEVVDNSATWNFDTGSATPAQDSIDILVTVKCEATGYGGLLPGKTQAAYWILTVPVSDEPLAPEEFEGWAGFGYNDENISVNQYEQSFDPASCKQLWFTEDVGYTRTGIALTEDYVYAASAKTYSTDDQDHLSCYDITDGSVKWTKYINPTWDGSNLFESCTSPYYFVDFNIGKVVIGGDRVWCFNAVNGNIEWEYHPDGWIFTENSPKYYEGKIYITGEKYPLSQEMALHCINASTGEKVWVSETLYGVTYSVPGIKDGKVYWGMTGVYNCFDANTGAQIWKTNYGKSSYDCMTIIGDRLYFVQILEKLVCMDLSSGAVLWEWKEMAHTGMFPHQFLPVMTYWIDSNDGMPVLCFRAEVDGGLHAIKDTGAKPALMWTWGWCDVSVMGSPVYNDGIVYFGPGEGDYLMGLDATNGKELYKIPIDSGSAGHGSFGQAAFAYDKLAVSAHDGVYLFE